MSEKSVPTKSRACDHCRARKIRCDKTESQDSACTPCIQSHTACTFVQKSTARSPPKWYIAGLEAKVGKLQGLLAKLHPGIAFPEIDSQIEVGCWTTSDRPWVGVSAGNSPAQSLDEAAQEKQDMKQLVLLPYYGVADPYHVMQSALRERFQKVPSEEGDQELFQKLFEQRRSDIWFPHPWERRLCKAWKSVQFTYPPPELATQLIDLYFEHSGVILPVLHRPTFMEKYESKLHEKDADFGSGLLLVCAIGSRWMKDDPRVLDQEEADGSHIDTHSAGWPFFKQVEQLPRLYSHCHNLETMQCYALSAIYLSGSSSLQVAYSTLGFALRLAQHMGLHRRRSLIRTDSSPRTRELWKRVFWILIVLDRLLSSGLGRACALYNEDIDLDLPLAIEDIDWPVDPMVSLPSSPSSSSIGAYFNSIIRLTGIRVEFLRKMNMEGYEHRRRSLPWTTSWRVLLNEMEGQLTSFFEGIPTHLRWEPSQPDQDLSNLRQSIFLHVLYYSSFISGHRASLHIRSSLISCVKAGRACIDVVAAANAMGEDDGGYCNGLSVFASACCILLGVWSPIPELNNKSELRSSITTALEVLSQFEQKWIKAGKYSDLLRTLISIDDTERLEHPSCDLTAVIPPAPSAESFPPVEGAVNTETLVAAVQNTLLASVGANTPNSSPAQFDIWSPPTNPEEWEAWQRFLNAGR